MRQQLPTVVASTATSIHPRWALCSAHKRVHFSLLQEAVADLANLHACAHEWPTHHRHRSARPRASVETRPYPPATRSPHIQPHLYPAYKSAARRQARMCKRACSDIYARNARPRGTHGSPGMMCDGPVQQPCLPLRRCCYEPVCEMPRQHLAFALSKRGATNILHYAA